MTMIGHIWRIGLIWLAFGARAQTNLLPPLPPTPTNVIHRVLVAPQNLNNAVLLSWNPYTNVMVNIIGSTDLVTWQSVTSVPIYMTNVVVPMTYPFQFFRFTNCTYSQ